MPTLYVRTVVSPQPHPLKDQLQEFGIAIGSAAKYSGYSYTHALNMLNGVTNLSDAFAEKVAELIAKVKDGRL